MGEAGNPCSSLASNASRGFNAPVSPHIGNAGLLDRTMVNSGNACIVHTHNDGDLQTRSPWLGPLRGQNCVFHQCKMCIDRDISWCYLSAYSWINVHIPVSEVSVFVQTLGIQPGIAQVIV